MGVRYIEKIKRTYENMVVIEYEYINKNTIYIRNINSSFKQEGNGTKALKSFLDEFKMCNIYLAASNEHGTDEDILFKWYKNLGFSLCDDVINNLCMTHLKEANK